jgi:hypothetical protein
VLKRKDAAYVKRSNRFREPNKQERKTKRKARLMEIASHRPNNPQKKNPPISTRDGYAPRSAAAFAVFGAVGWRQERQKEAGKSVKKCYI